jgi:hypothetical protein
MSLLTNGACTRLLPVLTKQERNAILSMLIRERGVDQMRKKMQALALISLVGVELLVLKVQGLSWFGRL